MQFFDKLFLGGIVVAGWAFCAGPDIYLESSGVGGVKYLIDIQIVCGLGAKELGHKILIKLLLVFIPQGRPFGRSAGLDFNLNGFIHIFILGYNPNIEIRKGVRYVKVPNPYSKENVACFHLLAAKFLNKVIATVSVCVEFIF